jgi:outer membrane protein insertion porin family
VSPRISLDVSRHQSARDGQLADPALDVRIAGRGGDADVPEPALLREPKLSTSVSGGYSNVQNISTFQASTLQGDYRITQKVKRTDTLYL